MALLWLLVTAWPEAALARDPADSAGLAQSADAETFKGTRIAGERLDPGTPADEGLHVALVGTFQPQLVAFSSGNGDKGLSRLKSGTEIRRTDIGIQAEFGKVAAEFVVNVAAKGSAAAAVTNATLSYADGPWMLTVGQQNQRVGFEGSSSPRSNTLPLMEKAAPTDLIAVAGIRQVGARLSSGSDSYSVSAGLFGLDVNNNGLNDLVSTGWATAARITTALVNDHQRLLHIGISGFYRENPIGISSAGARERKFRLRAAPEMSFDGQRLLDTGNIADARSVRLVGMEGIGQVGPMLWQMERSDQWVERRADEDLHFSASSITTSYMVTGEQRRYLGSIGQFARFRPRHSFDTDGHFGAFEAAVRWSRIAVHDPRAISIRPGAAESWTLGLSWILSPYSRIQANWVRSRIMLDTPLAKPSSLNILGIKVQQDW